MIRHATLQDADVLIAANIAMAKETEDVDLNPDRIGPGVATILSDPRKGHYYVGVSEEGAVVANLMITYEWSDWRNADIWWIQSVYVHPDHRRRGWYRRMYAHVQDEARAAGAAGLRLYVEQNNTRAQATYAALGMDGNHYTMYESMFDGIGS